jgi:hypothetical protein
MGLVQRRAREGLKKITYKLVVGQVLKTVAIPNLPLVVSENTFSMYFHILLHGV